MEITCNRCHQAILAENCYCPACGLPQLVYTANDAAGQDQPERWPEATRDASMVDWKPAMRAALMLAVPAGLLSSALSPVGILGLFWMAAAAAWAVALYLRTQRPAWITIGAGARIGLVTGLLAGWLAFGISGGALFVDRFVLHQTSQIDAEWKIRVDQSQQMTQQLASQMACRTPQKQRLKRHGCCHRGVTLGLRSSDLPAIVCSFCSLPPVAGRWARA